MKAPSPILKRVVLVGGGHSHAFVIKNFGMKPMPGVHVTLISKGYDTPYSGMVPGYVAGAYTREECYIDLAKLARFGKAEFVQGEVVGIDIRDKVIHLADGRPPISYDVVSIDIGSCPQPMDFSDSAIPVTRVKPIDGFGDRWNVLVERVLGSDAPFTFAVVGGGAGGVELVLSMQARLRKELARVGRPTDLVTAVLVTHTTAVLPSHNATVQRKFARLLGQRGVRVHLGRHVTAVRGRFIVSDVGEDIEADEVIWCTQASTQEWLRSTGLELHSGFIAVDDHLQSVNAPDVFAAGDVALMVNHPRPRAGVFAVRQGPPLAANIRHWLVGEPLEAHIPQTEFLGLISTGLPWCVASKGPMALEGEWLWDLKDWIDRKWMASYTTALPRMAETREDLSPVAIAAGSSALDALAHAAMRCGGCGSKVGASVLSRVLARLELPPSRAEVLVGLDHPDDCAIVRLPDSASGLAAVHTVDFFRSFITDPFVFGQIAANHALSDCHAMCADAVSALAIAVIPFAVEDKMEATLLQLMAGACKTLKEANCSLVGGHTSEGPEVAMGFAVNGLVEPARALRKSGLEVGDLLILTKPLGTGAIFAADMRYKARGLWVHGAIDSMLQSNKDAAFILRDVGHARACTDVTGFGYLGHLFEMAKASSVSVTVDLDAVPVLPGALECVSMGILSSLHASNFRQKRAVVNHVDAARHKHYPLLFDPQTAGGLVAGVPPQYAKACLEKLVEAGYTHAAIVGHVEASTRDEAVDRVQCVWAAQ